MDCKSFKLFLQALKILHNSPEFMPYVIFLAAPGMEQMKGLYENTRYSSRNLGTVEIDQKFKFLR